MTSRLSIVRTRGFEFFAKRALVSSAVVAFLISAGCGNDGARDAPANGPGGGSGGVTTANSGGASGAMQGAGSGGIAPSAGGNSSAAGATPSRGGATAVGVGGSGNSATGGAASGGTTNAGGATSIGGMTSFGGATSKGNGGTATGSGGSGNAGTGGAAMGGASSGCDMGTTHSGGKQYCMNSIGNAANGYSYQLWSNGQGSGCMTVFGSDATFKANWMGVGDFLARVGLGWDSTKTFDQLGTISSDFAFTDTISGGLTYIGIYGWSVSPLVEYYIMEDWVGSRPTGGGTKVDTFTIDGEGTYDVYQHMQVNQPSITGSNATFPQFFSVRQAARKCGHISISEHFKRWSDKGLQLGKMEEARILVEAMNNSGSIEFTTATVVVN
jgi:endo-1,4-beta-xylanase